MQAAVEARARRNVRTSADERFRRYKPETSRQVRAPEVKEDSVLAQLKEAFRTCPFIRIEMKATEENYEPILEHIKGLSYTAKDVEKFSIALAEFQHVYPFVDKAGLFLSALINNGSDSDYVIHTRHLAVLIDHFGFLNTKNVVVQGDIGYGCGKLMLSGTITVNGDAGPRAGFLKLRGKLVINGNVGYDAGYAMQGGEIHVAGEIGMYYRWKSRIGTRWYDQQTERGICIQGGRFYQGGELIEEKPEASNIEEAAKWVLARPEDVLRLIKAQKLATDF